MAAYRERPKTSVAWDHFTIQDSEKFVARCNHCQDSFSYRTSVSNLMKHLRVKHSYIMVNSAEDEEDVEEESERKDKRKALKSEVWEYFEIKDAANRTATCNLCSEEFSYRSTSTNLNRHLRRKHCIEIGKECRASDDEDTELEKSVTSHNSRYRYSLAWEHFTIADAAKKVASCNLCGATCSFRSSVSNLMKHARRKHNIDVIKYADDDGSDADDASPPRVGNHRSVVWLYFRQIDKENKVSQCLICKKMLSHSSSLTNLKKHLSRKHPNVLIPEREDGKKRILVSSGGELYELDTQNDNGDDIDNETDNLGMDTVYLEDIETLEQDQQPAPKKRKISTKLDDYDSSSEEEITFNKKYVKKQQDSLDYFGKYLASLLKQLPKEISNQLQSDFVKQAMNAQLSYDAQKVIETQLSYDAQKVIDTQLSYEAQKVDNTYEAQKIADTQESDSNSSTTWGYFEKERGKVRCQLCRAYLASDEASTDELKRHLNEKHPDLDENDQNSDNEQEREIDGDIFTEVIYLEDENPRKTVKRQRISKTAHLEATPRAFTRKRTKLIRRKDSTSSDEVLVKSKNSEDEEIEKFAKYITCLLKTVPKDVSTKLQMEIVSLIMSAKLKIQEKPENPVAGPSYILTVPSTSIVESNSDTKREGANDTIVTVPVTVSSSLSNEFYTIDNQNVSENK